MTTGRDLRLRTTIGLWGPQRENWTQEVKDWLKNLADGTAKGAIIERIERMKIGNFGKIDTIKSEPGLSEMIVDVGPATGSTTPSLAKRLSF